MENKEITVEGMLLANNTVNSEEFTVLLTGNDIGKTMSII